MKSNSYLQHSLLALCVSRGPIGVWPFATSSAIASPQSLVVTHPGFPQRSGSSALRLMPLTVTAGTTTATTTTVTTGSSTALFAVPPAPKRQPRRKMQKRRSRRPDGSTSSSPDNAGTGAGTTATSTKDTELWQKAELRPLISSTSKELGEDYWIDEDELRKIRERKTAVRPRREPGQVTDEKLWTEILSPYKQNWIGIMSVVVIIFAFIFKNFPEVMNPPIIPIPDL